MEKLGRILGNLPVGESTQENQKLQKAFQRGKEQAKTLRQWAIEHPLPSPFSVEEVKAWEREYEALERKLGIHRANYTCLACRDTGWVLGDDGLPIPCPGCSKFNPRESLKKYAGLPDRRLHDTFESFDLKRAPRMKEAFDAALEFAQGASLPWLVLASPPGTGKTHLAYAIANKIISDAWATVRFWVVVDLLDKMREIFATSQSDSTIIPQREFEYLAFTPQILILDDLGAEKYTAWVNEELFQVIDKRYREGKGLVITTNVDIDRLPERIRSRFTDRQMCRIVLTDSPDFRPQMFAPQYRRDKKTGR